MRILGFFCVAALAWGQADARKKQTRDLKYEPDKTMDAPVAGNVRVPRSYAVVIGVSSYPKLKPAQQLKFTEADAESINSILISKEGGNFQVVHKLTGSRANLANIRKELEEWLPSVAHDDDRVLIYFAGHGFVYKGKVYLAPSDFDPANIESTGYSTEALGAAFGSKIKGKWKVLLTDACHSGAATTDTDVRTINTRLLDLNRSVYSLTASRDREVAFESPDMGGGHGVFSYYVVKGLEGEADESKDGIVTADELTAYVQRNVRDYTKGRQNPHVGSGFDNNMLLAFNPTGARSGKPPQPKFGTLIFETNLDNVEVFVDGKSAGLAGKGKNLTLPGLTPGVHQVKAVHMGYEPVGPREEMVYPGQETTVTLKLLIPRKRTKAALDKLDTATEQYLKARGPDDYRRAVRNFQEILTLDPTFSQAALFLARAYRDLTDYDQSAKHFQKAIELDPDYMEARRLYGGMLFDRGDVDEAIRQLNTVVRREKNDGTAWYLLAQAFRLKERYDEAIDAAQNAVRVNPNNAEAHLWLAEGIRMKNRFLDAIPEYKEYLRLSNYNSSAVEKFGYYFIGFGLSKKRAANTDVWREMRAYAYFGLCNCEEKLFHFDNAIFYCQKALTFDKGDPLTHYVLGRTYMKQAQATGDAGLLVASRKHFNDALTINPDLEQSAAIKGNIQTIDKFLKAR
ncbi:MAG: tetratricopeptide repeat protein [Acidobacteria bacterium]|nr:tetratricopeptide repeat protein [Acidobacteriota bacterium]